MRKFILIICACLLIVTSSAHAEFLKDDAGFWYVNSYNNLIFSQGSSFGSAYDLSSIHIVANNNSRFEFNVIVLHFRNRDGSITQRNVANFREDYGTGRIFVNGKTMETYENFGAGKTRGEIYYKMKSVALSR